MKINIFVYLILWLLMVNNILCAEKFIADLSSKNIEVDSNFNGRELLIFGTVNPENHLLITVSSIDKEFLVKKKERKFGIWIGNKQEYIKDMPDFYHIFLADNIADFQKIINSDLLDINLLDSIYENKNTAKNIFFDKFIEIKNNEKLYFKSYESVELKDELLFKAKLSFPSNVPLGNYVVQVFLYDNYQLLNIQNIPIHVYDKGFNQLLIRTAQENRALYFVLFMFLSIIAAFINNFILKRI